MAVLQKGKANYPFWGSSINLITGLDPLSLQTTSEATYAALLPGISNLTNRLRYYGFYCWLLDLYFKKEKKGNSTEQYKFIRRAELMIAIIMQSERSEVLQITGSNFAANLIDNQRGKVFDLADGADKTEGNTEVYWKYSSGAFGQYYYGPMWALCLVLSATNEDGDTIYNITQPHPRQKVSGKELADAFDQSLTSTIKELFYNNIKKGKLNGDDIPELIRYFFIDVVNVNSSEWPLYRNMLLDRDNPGQEIEEEFTYHRRQTILNLIESAVENESEYSWYNFLLTAYKTKLGTSSLPAPETIIGWYAYQFNEYFQYACGAIFWAALQHLYEFQQDQYLPSFVTKLTKLILQEIFERIPNITPESTLGEVLFLTPTDKDEEYMRNSIEEKIGTKPLEVAAIAFVLLFRLHNENKQSLFPLKEFMNRKAMIREGNMIDGLLVFNAAEGDKLEVFIEQFLLRKILYRHQMVAIRKMGNGTQSTHKFIIEDQYIRFIDNFPPRGTSPRMNALKNLMLDLKVINEENQITSIHKKLLAS